MVDDTIPQIFIVGAPRSGTSIVMHALRQTLPAYTSFTEGHFIDILPHVTGSINYFFNDNKSEYRPYKDFLVNNVAQTEVRRRVADVIMEIFAATQGPSFIDKTHGPSMIYALLHLKRYFPNSRAILLQRRAIEYMRSVMVKFTSSSWDENLGRWIRCADAYRSVKDELSDYCLMVDHYDLAYNRGSAAANMARHLRLTAAQQEAVLGIVSNVTIEKTQGTDYAPLDVADLLLPDDVEKQFRELTASAFEWLGYSYDASYFRDVARAE